MTAEQCACRQAEHENLISRLSTLLKDAYDDYGIRRMAGDFWCTETRQLLDEVEKRNA